MFRRDVCVVRLVISASYRFVSESANDASFMSVEQGFNRYDPFADNAEAGGADQGAIIHIRIQQRNGRKTLTTVQGIAPQFDKKKILKYCKKEFACNGTVIEHEEYGEVIQLQGDQRQKVADWLERNQIAKSDNIKVHGF